jgi:hypothetical protein
MRGRGERWKLDELIDFEVALGAWDGKSRPEILPRGERRMVFKEWLEQSSSGHPGKVWLGGLSWAARILGVAAFIGGAGAAWGSLIREREGVHVVLFLATTLFVPWLILLMGLMAWIFRPAKGGLAGPLLSAVASKFAGDKGPQVVARLHDSADLARAIGWRLAAKIQGAMANFHSGAVAGLLGMVFFRKVGFFWETTTETAMQRLLEGSVKVLSFPWGHFAPSLLPEIAGTRRGNGWSGGGESWWIFLILALAFWGILPRTLLQCFAQVQEWRVLKNLTFQAPRERKLWRVLTAVDRGADPTAPPDGALVIDVGGVPFDREVLRPFLLRRLRMNPVAWETVGVLDRSREASASAALAKAPAGIILLAEGWSLAPRQIEATLHQVKAAAEGRRVVFYVADFTKEGVPQTPKASEEEVWSAFVDELRQIEVEVVFHQEEEQSWQAG